MIDIDNPEIQGISLRLNARADVKDVRLLSSSIDLSRLPDRGNALVYDLNSSPEVQYSSGDNFFVIKIEYDLDIDDASDPSENEAATGDEEEPEHETVAHVGFTLAALFALNMRDTDEPPTDGELEAFSLTTAQLLLYPYAREYVYDTTGRLGLPALTIGMLKMTTAQHK